MNGRTRTSHGASEGAQDSTDPVLLPSDENARRVVDARHAELCKHALI